MFFESMLYWYKHWYINEYEVTVDPDAGTRWLLNITVYPDGDKVWYLKVIEGRFPITHPLQRS
jgi:hypothetical protein